MSAAQSTRFPAISAEVVAPRGAARRDHLAAAVQLHSSAPSQSHIGCEERDDNTSASQPKPTGLRLEPRQQSNKEWILLPHFLRVLHGRLHVEESRELF